MSLTADEVLHISRLAKVALSPQDIERLRVQLSNILENFEVLKQVDTDGVLPTGHAIDLSNVMRDDVAQASYPQEQILANAPDRDGEHFKVRAILEF